MIESVGEHLRINGAVFTLVSKDPKRPTYRNGKVILEKSSDRGTWEGMWCAYFEGDLVWKRGYRTSSPEDAIESLYELAKLELSHRSENLKTVAAEQLKEAEAEQLRALADVMEITRFWKEGWSENE